MSENHKIQDPPGWWQDDEDRHRLARTLRDGPVAIREEADLGRVIFANPGEQELIETGATGSSARRRIANRDPGEATQFDVRIERSDFGPHAWQESIESIARVPFKAQIQYEGWDEEIQGVDAKDDGPRTGLVVNGVERKPWVDTIDGKRSMHDWGAETFEADLFEGIRFALIDQDPRKFDSSEARREAGARPRLRTFDRKDVWHFTRSNAAGDEELAMVVLNRPVVTTDTTDPNNWSSVEMPGFQVILAPDIGATPGSEASKVRSRVYVKEEEATDYVEQKDQRRTIEPVTGKLTEIPFVPLYGRRTGFFRGDSPFLRTAESQMALSGHSSELMNHVRETCLTLGFFAGVEADKLSSQPTKDHQKEGRFMFGPEGSTFGLHQPDPGTISVVETFIANKAEAIRKAHRQIHSETPSGPVTAREITLQAVYAASQLEMWIRLAEASWTKILDFMALLAGLPKRGTATISHDFGLPSIGLEMLWEGYKETDGLLVPPEVVWPEVKRHGWIDESQKVDDIVKLVKLAQSGAREDAIDRAAATPQVEREGEEDGEPSI